jgi:hypothetical protein
VVVRPLVGRRRAAAVVDLWEAVCGQLQIAEASGHSWTPGPIKVVLGGHTRDMLDLPPTLNELWDL